MIRWIAPLMLSVAACTPLPMFDPLPDPVPVEIEDTCGAAAHAGLIGQDASALERVHLRQRVRVIQPGMAVTMDYGPDRINFEIDTRNRIARIFCG